MASEIMYRNEISMSQKVSIKTNVYLLKTNLFFASFYTLQYIKIFIFNPDFAQDYGWKHYIIC